MEEEAAQVDEMQHPLESAEDLAEAADTVCKLVLMLRADGNFSAALSLSEKLAELLAAAREETPKEVAGHLADRTEALEAQAQEEAKQDWLENNGYDSTSDSGSESERDEQSEMSQMSGHEKGNWIQMKDSDDVSGTAWHICTWETELRHLFERYDMDNSGKIDSQIELEQLAINTVVKCQSTVPLTEIENRVAELADSDDGINMKFDQYNTWVHSYLNPPGCPDPNAEEDSGEAKLTVAVVPGSPKDASAKFHNLEFMVDKDDPNAVPTGRELFRRWDRSLAWYWILLVNVLLSIIILVFDTKRYDGFPYKYDLFQQFEVNFSFWISGLFTFEAIVKMSGNGMCFEPEGDEHDDAVPYFQSRWNVISFLVLCGGWYDMLVCGYSTGANCSLSRFGRAMRPFRVIPYVRGMQIVCNAFISAIPALAGVIFAANALYFCFAITGVNLFGNSLRFCTDADVPSKEACIGVPNPTVTIIVPIAVAATITVNVTVAVAITVTIAVTVTVAVTVPVAVTVNLDISGPSHDCVLQLTFLTKCRLVGVYEWDGYCDFASVDELVAQL